MESWEVEDRLDMIEQLLTDILEQLKKIRPQDTYQPYPSMWVGNGVPKGYNQ